MTNANDPAFPCTLEHEGITSRWYELVSGFTKREEIAKAIMVSYAAVYPEWLDDVLAIKAVKAADALIAALNKV